MSTFHNTSYHCANYHGIGVELDQVFELGHEIPLSALRKLPGTLFSQMTEAELQGFITQNLVLFGRMFYRTFCSGCPRQILCLPSLVRVKDPFSLICVPRDFLIFSDPPQARAVYVFSSDTASY
jgi:hypothetical protein